MPKKRRAGAVHRMADTVAGSLAAAWWAAAMVPGGMEKAEAAEVIVG